jgi:hypothetical protein
VSPDEAHRLAIALESLNGTVTTGFATVRGDINLLARGEHENTRRIDELETDVEELKSRRFPLPVIGGLCGIAAVLLSVIDVLGKG